MIFKAGNYTLPLDKKTHIMAVINLTPDSFFAGSRFTGEAAIQAALRAAADGADIIDIGAQSTAPGAPPITAKEEIGRLLEVLPALRKAVDLPISVDTYFYPVAQAALENGADIINDVSGLADSSFAMLAAEHKAGWIVMHTAGKSSSEENDYLGSVVDAVNTFFARAVHVAQSAGIPLSNLCLDPGIGFGKSRADDLEIIRNFAALESCGCAKLAALSRKRVTRLCGDALSGTIAANTACISAGANIIRVHDVAEGAAAARMADLIKGSENAWTKL